jgi:hypothetical protein
MHTPQGQEGARMEWRGWALREPTSLTVELDPPVSNQPSETSNQQSAISHQPSAISHQ